MEELLVITSSSANIALMVMVGDLLLNKAGQRGRNRKGILSVVAERAA